MVVLYRRDADYQLRYRAVRDGVDDAVLISHAGKVGELGSPTQTVVLHEAIAQRFIHAFYAQARKRGYAEIPHEQWAHLVVQLAFESVHGTAEADRWLVEQLPQLVAEDCLKRALGECAGVEVLERWALLRVDTVDGTVATRAIVRLCEQMGVDTDIRIGVRVDFDSPYHLTYSTMDYDADTDDRFVPWLMPQR